MSLDIAAADIEGLHRLPVEARASRYADESSPATGSTLSLSVFGCAVLAVASYLVWQACANVTAPMLGARVTSGDAMDRKISVNKHQDVWRQVFEFFRDVMQFAGRRGLVAAALVVGGAFLEGVGLVMLIPVLAIVTGSGNKSSALKVLSQLLNRLGLQTLFGKLAFVLTIFAVLMILRAIMISLRDTTLAQLQLGFVEDRRKAVTRRLAAARWDVISRLRHARITHLMSSDIQQIGSATYLFQQCAVSAVMLISQCILAFALSPFLACFSLVILAAGAAVLTPALRSARDLGGYVTGANLALMNSATQFLSGLKLAISQNLQAAFVAEFEDTLGALRDRTVEYQRQQTNRRLAFGTLSALVGALAVLIGFGVLHIQTAVVITLLLVLARMTGPATQVQQSGQLLMQSLPAYQHVKALEFELAAAAQSVSPSVQVPTLSGDIVFRDVGFRHGGVGDDEIATLRNINLTIPAGAFIGITGPSGAGKTIFADLLVGLHLPQTGHITVGGIRLQGPALDGWRNQVSYVAQDAFLFHDTIRRNLLWVNPQASEADLWAALRLAGADMLVSQLPEGLETIVGERGTLMSGGERQRIALARAVLRKPSLIVLDEATNAIDIVGERAVLERLAALTPRPTIVMIAHRIESTSLCERVLTLASGQFIQNDSHPINEVGRSKAQGETNTSPN